MKFAWVAPATPEYGWFYSKYDRFCLLWMGFVDGVLGRDAPGFAAPAVFVFIAGGALSILSLIHI